MDTNHHHTRESEPTAGWLTTGVFLTSFTLLATEIALTRALSVLLSYHFVFAVLSLALMGQGLGALYLAIRVPMPENPMASMHALAQRAVQCACAISFCVTLLSVLGRLPPCLPVYLVVVCPPFFFGGLFFAEVFRSFTHYSARIYGADLAGAAAGCAGIIILLQRFSATQSLYTISLVALTAAWVLISGADSNSTKPTHLEISDRPAGKNRHLFLIVAGLPIAILLLLSFRMDYLRRIPVGTNPEKEISDALRQGRVERTVWSALGQTDLVAYPLYPHRKDMYIDGTAGSPMYRFSGDIHQPGEAVADLLQTFPGAFPLRFLTREEKGRALIIGPGGGRDVLLTLAAGFQQIDAVEVNRDFVDLVRSDAEFNGGIYSEIKSVHVMIGEGRSMIKRQTRPYDLILMSLPATNVSRSREGFSMTENFLLTAEAIEDYLDHLTPQGRLMVVTHGEVEALRLLIVALKALSRRGLDTQTAMRQMFLMGDPNYPVFVLQRRPIAKDYIMLLINYLKQRGYDALGSYFPYMNLPGTVNPGLAALASGRQSISAMVKWAKGNGHDIGPASDNRPFFFKFEPGVPGAVWWVLGVSGMFLTAVIVAMTASHRGCTVASIKTRDTSPWRFICLFMAMGAGFMVVEIAMAQHCFLFIGRPILSITITLFSLLAGAGLGGWASRQIPEERLERSVSNHLLVAVLMVSAMIFLLPVLFDVLLGCALQVRVAMAAVCLMAAGFTMGFPFPLALRLLHRLSLTDWVPWMLGINGMGSVLGSALCTAIAATMGMTQAMWLCVGLYAFSWVILKF